jgi:protein-S-isoprenylcysteine O-methyltransferase Ste14
LWPSLTATRKEKVTALVWRLLDEEKFLKRNLPGYAEYAERVPCRLVPFVW